MNRYAGTYVSVLFVCFVVFSLVNIVSCPRVISYSGNRLHHMGYMFYGKYFPV